MVPASAEAYALNVPEGLKGVLPPAEQLAADPVVQTLREHFKATGKTQGQFDDLFEALGQLQAKGLVQKPLDFAAERAALGENGQARQREVETFAKSLQARGDIDEAEFKELMSLTPTRAGVTLIEKLRKMTGSEGPLKAPTDTPAAPDAATAAQEKARELARDPKYGKDKLFTQQADKAWVEAFKE